MQNPQLITWHEAGEDKTAHWNALTYPKPPSRIVIIDDTTNADQAFRLACEGTGMLWRGDYQNGRQLLQALQRRCDKSEEKKHPKKGAPEKTMRDIFNQYRMAQAQRARILGMLLLEFNADYSLNLRRAPIVTEAFNQAYGKGNSNFLIPMRELLGVVGAHEWRKNGVAIAALDDKIYPHYGVFSPIRGEYLDLISQAPLPAHFKTAFDIGTGTGVLAAILIKRGLKKVIATDSQPRALSCAKHNLQNLGLTDAVQLEQADLFPSGAEKADLLVCNPPWLPGKASSPLEHAVYDPDSAMLRGFLQGAAARLNPKGEAWLILSDLAEHLQLRSREQLLQWIEQAGLSLIARSDIAPRHGKSQDNTDPLFQARSKEITSLWRLQVAKKV